MLLQKMAGNRGQTSALSTSSSVLCHAVILMFLVYPRNYEFRRHFVLVMSRQRYTYLYAGPVCAHT